MGKPSSGYPSQGSSYPSTGNSGATTNGRGSPAYPRPSYPRNNKPQRQRGEDNEGYYKRVLETFCGEHCEKNCWTGYNCCCDTVAKMCTIRCENKSTGENAFNPQNGLDCPRYTHSKTEVYNKVESNLYGRCNDDCAG